MMVDTATKYFLLCFVLFVVGSVAKPSKLLKNYERCSLSSPDKNACVINALTSALPTIAKGVPSLGLFPVDPLRISFLEINQKGNSAVQIKLRFKDLDIINLSDSVLKDPKFDFVNYNFSLSLDTKKQIFLKGNYDVSGKVLILPITGNGTCKLTFDNFEAFGNIKLKKIVKNGAEYLSPQKIIWTFTTSKMSLKLDNLFNGDKALGDNMNVFLNENWRDLLKDLQPAIEEALVFVIFEYAKQFFGRVPLSELLKD
ncbi:protein takeout-like [Adelges cooleyi]|uniref:protein takeout-like n=1 Tax=Adelges cooleyi TaxID=133065 RepID=UPI00217F8FF3|nr:protein takeout-like [Adelges cooleyi]